LSNGSSRQEKNANTESRNPYIPKPSEIRFRALLIGLLLIPADNYWVITMEKVNMGPYPTVIAVFANTVFILTILIAFNSAIRRLRPQCALTTAEMLVIYSMITIAAALAGHDMMPTVIAFMSYPYRALATNPAWNDTFLPHLPRWLHVSDPLVIKPLYEGESSLYIDGHWKAWVLPGAAWVCFFTILVWTMMCINALIRKQWLEHERLTFPIVQLPIAMTEPKGEIWRNRLFWIGFGICFGIELINGLSVYWPAIPQFNLTERDHNLMQAVTMKPWSAIGWLPYTFYPFVIGIGYLLPTDLCFSVWFFYLTWKVQKVVACILGMEVGFDDPYIRYQEAGGAIALVLMLIWASRGYLQNVWRQIVENNRLTDDSREPLSYRTAAVGAVVGLALLVGFMKAIGMSPMLAIAAFVVYFVLAVVITRIRAELGPPVHDMPFTPDYLITSAIGVGRLSNGDILGLGYFHAFHGAYRAHPMPIGLEALKMAAVTRSSPKKIFWALILAALVGAGSTVWAYLHLAYKYGLDRKWNYGAAWGWTITKLMHNWWMRGSDIISPNWPANIAMLAGFIFCLFLSLMRMKVISFPLHPIGFVISGSYQAHLVWLPLLIAWLIKVNILRYGGLRVYRSALPFFFGMIVGELTMGCLWGVIGMTFGIPYYNFFGA
jgi:hypothetical protein